MKHLVYVKKKFNMTFPLVRGQVGIWIEDDKHWCKIHGLKPYLSTAYLVKQNLDWVYVKWISPTKGLRDEVGGWYRHNFQWTDKILQV